MANTANLVELLGDIELEIERRGQDGLVYPMDIFNVGAVFNHIRKHPDSARLYHQFAEGLRRIGVIVYHGDQTAQALVAFADVLDLMIPLPELPTELSGIPQSYLIH